MAYFDQPHTLTVQGKDDRFPQATTAESHNITIIQPKDLRGDISNSNAYASSPPALVHAFQEISDRCGKLRLPKDVCDIAKQIYKNIEKDGVVSSRRLVKPFAGACIFLACRSSGFDCTLSRIQKAMGVKKTTLGECYYVLEKKFNPNSAAAAECAPEDAVVRWASELGLHPSVEMACQFVIGAMSQHDIGKGRSRGVTAAGALYFTCRLLGHVVPACEVLRVSGVGLRSLEGVYKRLYREKERLTRPEWIMDGMANLDLLPAELV